MNSPSQFCVKIFADGADLKEMLLMYNSGIVSGFTTNPTLIAKAGIQDYRSFALSVVKNIPDLPISFEVLSDDLDEMYIQAKKISEWGHNVNIKIPVMNTKGDSTIELICGLLDEGVCVNVTAVFTHEQLKALRKIIDFSHSAIVSIFAGRIADVGIDPLPTMKFAVDLFAEYPSTQILWASPREVLNIYQADEIGADIITATPDLIKKLSLKGKDLTLFSKETVKMFYDDALSAGFSL